MRDIGISKIFDDLEHFAQGEGVDFPCVRSPNVREQFVSGFVYAMERGHGIVITAAMNTYHLPARMIAENKLETGDYIEAMTDDYTVQRVLKFSEIKPNAIKAERPNCEVQFGKVKFKLGSRVCAMGGQDFDFIDYISKIKIPTVKRVAILIDQGDDCMEFLDNSGFEKVYSARVNHNLKKRVMLALYALFISKQMCARGENVLLCVDNFNKLFRIYNSTFNSAETVDILELHVGPYMDLKSYFMEARQNAGGGSLTILANVVPPKSDIEKFVVGEFTEMCSTIIAHEHR
jgi:hypothetical protein